MRGVFPAKFARDRVLFLEIVFEKPLEQFGAYYLDMQCGTNQGSRVLDAMYMAGDMKLSDITGPKGGKRYELNAQLYIFKRKFAHLSMDDLLAKWDSYDRTKIPAKLADWMD